MKGNELSVREDWRIKIDELADKLISTSFFEFAFDDEYLKKNFDTVYEIYLDRVVNWKNFFIENIIEDIQDHDECILEEMADIIMQNNGIKYSDLTHMDAKAEIIQGLAEEYRVCLWIEYPVTSLDSIPFFLVKELRRRNAYYEILWPSPGSWQAYQGAPKLTFGFNDAQNVLFPDLVSYDTIHDYTDNTDEDIPVICRHYYNENQNLIGGA